MIYKSMLPLVLILCIATGCLPAGILVANPPGSQSSDVPTKPASLHEVVAPPASNPAQKKSAISVKSAPEESPWDPQPTPQGTSEDPGLSPAATAAPDPSDNSPFAQAIESSPKPFHAGSQSVTFSAEPFVVPGMTTRIAVLRNVEKATIAGGSEITFHSGSQTVTYDATTPITLFANKTKETVHLDDGLFDRSAFALPCTVDISGNQPYFSLEKKKYRGTCRIVSEQRGKISLINVLTVDEYLRGVIPLEIGRLPMESIEAIKAQAIAARTYTYRRIVERKTALFDMVATVDDQVYGGMHAECASGDSASLQTRGQVLTWNDTLVAAYYHSTCGGKTATIHEVWDKKPAYPYLTSRADVDKLGKAYCSISPQYLWEEEWSVVKLSEILSRFSKSTSGVTPLNGTLTRLKVAETFNDGRVKQLAITTSQGTTILGGDKTRFVLRRPDRSILKSARFAIVTSGGSTISIKGHGYGHGVGMCQMGAIGRAQAGQNCSTILGAYYPGTTLRTVKIHL